MRLGHIVLINRGEEEKWEQRSRARWWPASVQVTGQDPRNRTPPATAALVRSG